ncbi:hypothetical protein HanXRQr2_Chr14g0655911 [Helianthus annuus]|uniref:Uncharacterized protein n=1 Tax=Helianthus annuus TaxID=4232 RepID=A0A9K3EAQ7_HELAN|nr:hypothetical protein HanXRQr2_Chr14g0655911 [Helianthus annuus]
MLLQSFIIDHHIFNSFEPMGISQIIKCALLAFTNSVLFGYAKKIQSQLQFFFLNCFINLQYLNHSYHTFTKLGSRLSRKCQSFKTQFINFENYVEKIDFSNNGLSGMLVCRYRVTSGEVLFIRGEIMSLAQIWKNQ